MINTKEMIINIKPKFLMSEYPNLESKRVLINKINQIKLEAESSKNSIVLRCRTLISEINEKSYNVIEKLENFINLCSKIIADIHYFQSIPSNQIYNPLTSALLSGNISNLIQKMHPPKISFFDSSEWFSYIPSTFPHYLYNFSDFTAGFIWNNKLIISPLSIEITNAEYDWSSKILLLDNNKILITGGGNPLTNECFELNFKSQVLRKISPLKSSRYWHTNSWINNMPAVIGGFNKTCAMKSVEIYNGHNWTEINSLNQPRYFATAVACFKATWIVGGENVNKLDSIEKFENNSWTLINVKLFNPARTIGVICLENNILMFGGKLDNKQKIFNNYFFDTEKMTIIELLNNGESFFTFGENQCFISENLIFMYGDNFDNKLERKKIDLDNLFRNT